MDNPAFQVNVRLAVELMKQLLPLLDDDSVLVLDGDLSRFREAELPGVNWEEKGGDLSVDGRIAILLDGPTKLRLKRSVLSRIGLRSHIRDVSVERYGRLLFSAPNHFRHGALLSNWFKLEFIQQLEEQGIVSIAHARPSARLFRQ